MVVNWEEEDRGMVLGKGKGEREGDCAEDEEVERISLFPPSKTLYD